MTHLHTIYDFADQSLRLTFLIPLPFAICGLILYYYYKDQKQEFSRLLHVLRSKKEGERYGQFMVAFAFLITIVVATNNIYQYNYTKKLYYSPKLSTTRGIIENYSFENRNEMFDVNGIHFEYNKNDESGYEFNNSEDDDIESGMFVSIKFYNNSHKNVILKLDIQK